MVPANGDPSWIIAIWPDRNARVTSATAQLSPPSGPYLCSIDAYRSAASIDLGESIAAPVYLPVASSKESK